MERTLTDLQRDEFEDLLRALTLERSQIKEAMGFALDNADAAGEVLYLAILSNYYSFLFFSSLFALLNSTATYLTIRPVTQIESS